MVTDFSVKAQSVRNTTLTGVSFLSPPPPELDWRREGGGGGGGIREGGREGGVEKRVERPFPSLLPTYVPKGVCLSVCGMHGERKSVLSYYLLLGAAIKQQFTLSCSACCAVSQRFTHIAGR